MINIARESPPATLTNNAALISQLEQSLATFNNTNLGIETLEESVGMVESTLTESAQVFISYQAELLAAQTECIGQLSQFHQSISTSTDLLGQTNDTVQQSLDALEVAIENEISQAKSSVETLSSKLDEMVELVGTVDSGLGAVATEVGNHFEALDDGLANLEQQVESLQSETVARLAAIASSFEDTLPATINPFVDQLNQQLTQDQRDVMQSGFADFEGQLSGLLEQFNQEFDALGSDLEQRGSLMLNEVTEHFNATLRQEIEDTFAEIVSDVLSEVMEEVSENIVLTQVGQSTTAALGTALPFIAAAKVATGVLSAIDDVF